MGKDWVYRGRGTLVPGDYRAMKSEVQVLESPGREKKAREHVNRECSESFWISLQRSRPSVN